MTATDVRNAIESLGQLEQFIKLRQALERLAALSVAEVLKRLDESQSTIQNNR
jgi:hypothetical protein